MRSTTKTAVVAAVSALAACVQLLDPPDRIGADHVVCEDSSCTCEPGYGDCNDDLGDGCESVLDSDPLHCGDCSVRCGSGACEGGACGCSDGTIDCDEDETNGCETDARTDPLHCGACGHDCLGGECVEGLCQPRNLHEASYPNQLAQSANAIFYSEYGSVQRIGKDGTGFQENIIEYELRSPRAMVFEPPDAEHGRLFALTENFLASVDETGHDGVLLGDSPPVLDTYGAELAVLGEWLYIVSNKTDTLVHRVSASDGAVVEELDSTGTGGLARDGGRVAWGHRGDVADSIVAIDATGATSTIYTTPAYDGFSRLALEGDLLFLDSFSGPQAIDLSTGDVVTFVDEDVGGFAVRDGIVYFINPHRSTIEMWQRGMVEPAVLTSGLNNATSNLLVDDEALYFGTEDGVFKLAR